MHKFYNSSAYTLQMGLATATWWFLFHLAKYHIHTHGFLFWNTQMRITESLSWALFSFFTSLEKNNLSKSIIIGYHFESKNNLYGLVHYCTFFFGVTKRLLFNLLFGVGVLIIDRFIPRGVTCGVNFDLSSLWLKKITQKKIFQTFVQNARRSA